jgi:hypothetical protein
LPSKKAFDTRQGTTIDLRLVQRRPISGRTGAVALLAAVSLCVNALAVFSNSAASAVTRGSTTVVTPPPVYVGLGDSYSAGEGVAPCVKGTDVPYMNMCHRSVRGSYEDLILKATANRTFKPCSGATIADFRLNNVEANNGEPPQLSWLQAPNRSPGYVTFTIGGNDLGFGDILKACIQIKGLVGGIVRTLASPQADCQPLLTAETQKIPTIQTNLVDLYQKVLQAAPTALVRVLNYPQLFPTNFRGWQGDCMVSQVGVPNVVTARFTFARSTVTAFNTGEASLNNSVSTAISTVRAMNTDYARRLALVDLAPPFGNNTASSGHTISCGDGGRPQ